MENKHITQPDGLGFQVRIVRNKKEHSRYFSHRQWGGKQKALTGARGWRDQMLISLGDRNKYLSDQTIISTKKTTGIRGVSKSIQFDKRRSVYYMVYSVHWRINGKVKTKTFHVGRADDVTADQEVHAFRTAVRFRREYELSKAMEDTFNPDAFKLWRDNRLYDQRKKIS